jgi:hypothetical protein
MSGQRVTRQVDHGTAFDVANTGVADKSSMLKNGQAAEPAPQGRECDDRPEDHDRISTANHRSCYDVHPIRSPSNAPS